jgi:NAD(P)-dependent dehydrogenase (short-subunit alcohol dehydrogenase family)
VGHVQAGGATSGIGEPIARRFAAEGALVAVVGRNPERGAASIFPLVFCLTALANSIAVSW